MEITPQMERDSYKQMKQSLKVFWEKRSLTKMSGREISKMPKEVILACAADEIALVWDKLPEQLQNDVDILKYQYCQEHYHNSTQESSGDAIDGPPPRRLFCCYCQIRDVKVTNHNSGGSLSTNNKPSHGSFCCKQQ